MKSMVTVKSGVKNGSICSKICVPSSVLRTYNDIVNVKSYGTGTY